MKLGASIEHLLAALLLGLAAIFVWLDAAQLIAHSFAVGLDGYYYVQQVESLSISGRPYFPTATPFTLYLLTGIYWLVGDAALAVKIGSLCLHVSLCAGVFGIVASATRSFLLGSLSTALMTIAGSHAYLVIEFINQLGALAFLAWSGYFAMRALERQRPALAWPALVCLLAALFSHRSALPLTLLIGTAALSIYFLTSNRHAGERWRRALWPLLVLLWCAPALFAIQPILSLPQRISAELLSKPTWPFIRAAAPEQLALLVVAPAALWLTLVDGRRVQCKAAVIAFGSAALWALLLTLNPFLNNQNELGVSWRLRALAYIQVALLVPGIIRLTSGQRRAPVLIVVIFAAALVIWSAYKTRPAGVRPAYLQARRELLNYLPSLRGRLGPSPFVISPHGEEFIVTWALGVPSQQKPPEHSEGKTIYWLLHSFDAQRAKLPVIIVASEGGNESLVLVKDEDLWRYLTAEGKEEWGRLLTYNRHLLEHTLRLNDATYARR